MVAPFLAAAFRTTASGAVKQAGKKAVKSAARKKATDILSSAEKKALNLERSNARRRFNRAASRYEKMADKAVGATKERYETLAAHARTQAVNLKADVRIERQREIIRESEMTLQGKRKDPTVRAEMEANEILRTTIGSRIFAGTQELWDGLPDDEKIPTIMEHFGVSSKMELIEKIEEITEGRLYEDPENKSTYDVIKLMIQANIARGFE